MIRICLIALLGTVALWLTASANPLPITLTLTPSGVVSGLPGSTVGWGYSIDNTSDDYLLVQNSYFCAGAEDPALTTCSPSLGASTYQDFIANNFTEIAPGTTAMQSFDANTDSGVGEYSIDPSASPGQSDSGSIFVVYDLYTSDFLSPNYSCCQVGGDMEIAAAAGVEVTAAVSRVPEPHLPFFLLFGFAAIVALTSRRPARAPAGV